MYKYLSLEFIKLQAEKIYPMMLLSFFRIQNEENFYSFKWYRSTQLFLIKLNVSTYLNKILQFLPILTSLQQLPIESIGSPFP